MNSRRVLIAVGVLLQTIAFSPALQAKEKINALIIPLADHYSAILAHARYKKEMKEADFEIELMKSWESLRGKFMSGEADVAFLMSPLAMDMYAERPDFKWISLAHRNGNALAVDDLLAAEMKLPEKRASRKPDDALAKALKKFKAEKGVATIVATPSARLSTHTLVLYKYLKDHGVDLTISQADSVPEAGATVVAKTVAPPKAPEFLKFENSEGRPAAFEQSLPWADIVETQHFGKVAWYSKDVLKTSKGHVECIIIATDKAIKNKNAALKEVVRFVHRAAKDLDDAIKGDGAALQAIAQTINKDYIPAHSVDAIVQSLDKKLEAINYRNLNVDKEGLKMIMDLGVQAKTLQAPIDINQFADESFSTKFTGK